MTYMENVKPWLVRKSQVATVVALLYDTTYSDMLSESSVMLNPVAQANNDFVIDFYRQVSAENENVFSLVSTYVVFSAPYDEITGETVSQMVDVLDFEPDEKRHNTMSRTISSLNRRDPHTSLKMANLAWLCRLAPLLAYVGAVLGICFTDIEEFNSPKDDARMISPRASDKIHRKISEIPKSEALLDDNGAEIALANTVCFRRIWTMPFPAEGLCKSDFWRDASQSVKTDFMTVCEKFNYTEQNNMHVFKMLRKGDRPLDASHLSG